MEKSMNLRLPKDGEPIPERLLRSARTAGRRVAVIGGGTGLSTLLLGLKEYTENITAIVTVTDDGGSSGKLRREFGILPPGDIRNCILALADTNTMMNRLLSYRFPAGSLEGQNFGNLFLLALNNICGSFEEAVASMNQILAVTGKVLPVCTQNISLQATFADGSCVTGETAITAAKKERDLDIRAIRLVPGDVQALPQALEALEEAELIVLGPGSLYTSIIPNLLVGGVADALRRSRAMRIYALNVMTQDGETEHYTAWDHARAILDHGGCMDACLYNTRAISRRLADRYSAEGGEPIRMEPAAFERAGIRLFGGDMLSRSGSLARHDPLRLAYHVMLAADTFSPRSGALGDYDRLLLRRR